MKKSYVAALVALTAFASPAARAAGNREQEEAWEQGRRLRTSAAAARLENKRLEEIAQQPATTEELAKWEKISAEAKEVYAKTNSPVRNSRIYKEMGCGGSFAPHANALCVNAKLNKQACIRLDCNCKERNLAEILDDTIACLQAPEPAPQPANSGTDCETEFTFVSYHVVVHDTFEAVPPGSFVIATNRALCPSTRWRRRAITPNRSPESVEVFNPDGELCIYDMTPELRAFANSCARSLLGLPEPELKQKGAVRNFLDAQAAEVKNFVGPKVEGIKSFVGTQVEEIKDFIGTNKDKK